MNQKVNLPFVLLWADNVPNESLNRARLIFSPPVGGAIQDPNSHPVENETTGGIDGTVFTDSTRDF